MARLITVLKDALIMAMIAAIVAIWFWDPNTKDVKTSASSG